MKKIYELLCTTRAALMVLLMGLFLLAGTMARAQEVTIFTDKDDYYPGEWVVITGEGWQGDDSVKIILEHIEPKYTCTHP